MTKKYVLLDDVRLRSVQDGKDRTRLHFAYTRFRSMELVGNDWFLRDYVGTIWSCAFEELPDTMEVEEPDMPWDGRIRW